MSRREDTSRHRSTRTGAPRVNRVMKDRIYLDHASTTPVAEEVLTAMLPYFRETYGNPHSRSHAYGWGAAAAVDSAREAVADLLSCLPQELTFTSGSTEAIYLAIHGVARRYTSRGRHIVTTAVEHSAVLAACAELEQDGFEVTYLLPDAEGLLHANRIGDALREDTILCAVLWGNNETGVLQDMSATSAVCRARDVLLFADATQVVGKIECRPRDVGVDLLALSGHKFYGPKGVGALYVSSREPRVVLSAQQGGGGQEQGLRGGTLNVPGIVGLGAAAVLAKAEMRTVAVRLESLRQRLETMLVRALPAVHVNGAGAARLPHISNLSFRFTEAEALLSNFHRRLAVSTGSACASTSLEPSHVLLAMGLSPEDARAAIRISLGRETTAAEIDTAVALLCAAVPELRAESPLWELYEAGVLA